MSLNKLSQFALPVKSADVAETFYAQSLGLSKLFRFGDLVFFDCGGVRLMLEQTSGAIEITHGICHYFSVDNIDSSVADLKSREVVFVEEPHVVAEMPDHSLWMAFFADPDGHMLALMEERAK